jgi:hypothetical protein
MNRRWFGSFASVIASAGLAAAQGPAPVNSVQPPIAPSATTPIMVNGAPAPVEAIERKKAKDSALQPVAANGQATPSTLPPVQTPNSTAATTPVHPIPSTENLDAAPAVNGAFDAPAGPYRRIWGRTEYLLWYEKNMPLQPIIGAIPSADAAMATLPPGAIGPLFGGNSITSGALNGVRLELGAALDAAEKWTVTGEYFQLEHVSRGANFSSDSTGNPPLGPVFYDPTAGRETILLFSNPGIQSGSSEALDQNRLWGFEVDARRRVTSFFSDRLDLIVGYRHISFDESLDTYSVSNFLLPFPNPAAILSAADHFGVHNDFDGAVIGLEAEYDVGRCYLDLRGKFGMGNVHETWSISGSTNFVSNSPLFANDHFDGGVLAQPSNSGNFSRNRFDFLGEITVNGGVRLFNDHVKAFVGYNFLGLSKILRPDDVMDAVNPTVVPSLLGPFRTLTASAPAPKADDGRFWAEGLNFGLSFEF